MTGRRDETGVIAIIVAISLSTFLLGFAALAVDMGSAYARQSDIQATAEQLATAGAAGLPTISDALDAMETARVRLCVSDPLPGICGPTHTVRSWAQDGRLDNGEVRFYDDQGQAGMFAQLAAPAGLDAGDFLTYAAVKAAGLRVLLPPSRVEFGLASAIGFSGVNVTRAATARIGTPLGLGVLPFALTPDDLNAGQFCVKDTTVTGDGLPPDPVPAGTQIITTKPDQYPNAVDPAPIRADDGDKDLHFSLQPLPVPLVNYPRYRNVVWHTSNSARFQRTADAVKDTDTLGPPPRYNSWTVTVPEAPPSTIYVWATGSYQATIFSPRLSFISQASQVKFTGATPPRDDLCDRPAAKLRGFVSLARTDGGGLTANVRQGPQAKLYDATSDISQNLLNSTLACASAAPESSTACLSQQLAPRTNFMDRVSTGLLTSSGGNSGRLLGNCGMSTRPGRPGVDPSQLIDGSNAYLLNSHTPDQLLTQILTQGQNAASDGYEGAISSRALRCPRMAVMPVVEPLSIAGLVSGQKITRFVYVWIDEAGSPASDRGLNFVGSRLASVRGYVIQPELLPKQVAGSPLIGPYMGSDMPKQVVLVHDLGADGT